MQCGIGCVCVFGGYRRCEILCDPIDSLSNSACLNINVLVSLFRYFYVGEYVIESCPSIHNPMMADENHLQIIYVVYKTSLDYGPFDSHGSFFV